LLLLPPPQDDVIQGLRTTSKQMQRAQTVLKSPRASHADRTPPLSPRSPSFHDHRLAAAAAALLAAGISSPQASGCGDGAESASAEGLVTQDEDDTDDARVKALLAQAHRVMNRGPRNRGAKSRLEAMLAQVAAAESDGEADGEEAQLLELLSGGAVTGKGGKVGICLCVSGGEEAGTALLLDMPAF
jgi:hypothetical protein